MYGNAFLKSFNSNLARRSNGEVAQRGRKASSLRFILCWNDNVAVLTTVPVKHRDFKRTIARTRTAGLHFALDPVYQPTATTSAHWQRGCGRCPCDPSGGGGCQSCSPNALPSCLCESFDRPAMLFGGFAELLDRAAGLFGGSALLLGSTAEPFGGAAEVFGGSAEPFGGPAELFGRASDRGLCSVIPRYWAVCGRFEAVG